MVNVIYIKFTVHIVLGTPQQVQYFSSDIIFVFLDTPRIQVFSALNITLVWVLSFKTETSTELLLVVVIGLL